MLKYSNGQIVIVFLGQAARLNQDSSRDCHCKSHVGFLIGCSTDRCVDYDSTDIPTTCGVNLVDAAAQVSLPTKQPVILKLPSQSKANEKALTTLSANNSPVVL